MVREDTAPGLLLGTVGYMSPEQVRGQPADARSDLFALGAILYELLTGRRAFAQSTPADTMTAILTADPPELTDDNTRLTAQLNRIIRHCLEKVPDERVASARDLAFNLETLTESSAAVGESHPRSRRASLPAWALLPAIVAGGLLTWGAFALGPRSMPRVPYYQQITFPERRGPVGALCR